MLMQRAVLVIGLAVVVSASVGCNSVQDPCELPRNGNDGVLNFSGGPPAAKGLLTEVHVSRVSPYFEGGPGTYYYSRDPRECLAFDDAELQVELPAAFQGEVATVTKSENFWGEFVVQFRCIAPAGQPQRVSVKVVAGAEVRYEDSFDVTCLEVKTATATPVAQVEPGAPPRSLTGNGYVVGGLVHVSYNLRDNAFSELGGSGAIPADSLLVSEGAADAWHRTQTFRAAAAGQSPALQVGSVRVELPITLVGDDAWQLEIEKNPARAIGGITPGVFDFRAWPVNAAGDQLDGIQTCQWTAHTSAGSTELLGTSCDLDSFATNPGTEAAITRLCVTSLGKTGCVDISQ